MSEKKSVHMIEIVSLWVLLYNTYCPSQSIYIFLSSGKFLFKCAFLKKLAKPSKEKKFNTSGLILCTSSA